MGVSLVYIVHKFVITGSLTEPAFALHAIGHLLQAHVLKSISGGPAVGCVKAFEIIEPGLPFLKPGAVQLPARTGIVRPFPCLLIIHG